MASAQSQIPQFFALDGRLSSATNPDEPLLDNSVNLVIQVLDPAKTCVLYEEQQTINTAVTQGYFNVQVGSATTGPTSAKRSSLDSANSMQRVFANQNLLINGRTAGGSACTYTPANTDSRYFRFHVTPASTGVTATLSPDMSIDSVPQALVAQSIQGLTPDNFVQITSDTTQSKVDGLFGTSYSALTALLAGSSTMYIRNSALGAVLPSRTTDPGTLIEGQIWFDSASNVLKYYDGATIQTLGVSGGDPTKLPLAGGTMAGDILMGGNRVLGTGHVTMSPLSTITIGRYTTAEQATLVAGLTGTNAGATWFNSDTGKLMFWDGSAPAIELADAAMASGDITAVTAGTGLTGGGTSGGVTLAVDLGNAAGQFFTIDQVPHCTSTQKLEMSAGPAYGWSCVTDNDSGGDITGVSVTAPITGGGGSGGVTVGLAYDNSTVGINGSSQLEVRNLGITAGKLADGSVITAKLDDEAVSTAKLGDASVTDVKVVSMNVSKITSAASQYFAYMPNGSECANGQTLIWNFTDDRWECGSFPSNDLIRDADGDTRINVEAAADEDTIRMVTSGSERMTVLPGGAVGIGTTNPLTPLHVQGNNFAGTGFNLILEDPSTYAADVGGGVAFRGRYNTAGTGMSFSSIHGGKENATDGSPSGYLQFSTRTSAGTLAERVRVDSTGAVGIGTSAPSHMLDVQKVGSGSTAPRLSVTGFTNGSNAAGAYLRLASSKGTSLTDVSPTNSGSLGVIDFVGVNANATPAWVLASRIIAGVDGAATATYVPSNLQFYTSDGSLAPEERLRIISNGNIGIGTTAPRTSLDVGAKTDAILVAGGTSAQRPGTGVNGMIRYNTDLTSLEGYINGSWQNIPALPAGAGYLSSSGGTLSGGLNISTGGLTIAAGGISNTGGLNNNSSGITNAGAITGVGANITGAGAMTVAAGGSNQSLGLQSSGNGSVNVGSANGTSLSVLDGGASTVNYVAVRGAATGAAPVISTAGADTNIDLRLSPKGTGNVIVTNGNVGIGTTAPLVPLHVYGSGTQPARIESSSSTSYLGFKASGTTTIPYIGTGGDDLRFNTNGATQLTVLSSGNVGIGTTAPNSPLYVESTLNYSGTTPNATHFAATFGSMTSGMVGVGRYNGMPAIQGHGTGTAYALHLNPSAGNIILAGGGGTVGIGTATPLTPLHIYNSAGPARFMLEDGTGATNMKRWSVVANGSSSRFWIQAINDANTGSGDVFYLNKDATGTSVSSGGFGNAALGNSALHVDVTNKRVAIGGTNNPSYDLSFDSGAGRTIAIERSAPGVVARTLTVMAGSAASGDTDRTGGVLNLSSGISTGANGSVLNFQTATGGSSGTSDNTPSTKMTIVGSGNVGIGSSAPAYKLDVNGSLNATSIFLNGTALSVTGTSTSVPNGGGSVQTITQTNTGAASANRSALTLRNDGTGGAFEYNLLGLNAAGAVTSSISQSGIATFANSVLTPSVAGGAVSSGNLTLESTTHATKGNIILAPSGGNVGIGTTTPTTTLYVNGQTTLNGLTTVSNSSALVLGDSGSLFGIRRNVNDQKLVISGGNSTTAGSNIEFYGGTHSTLPNGMTFNNGATEAMRISSSGNVGIGTISPIDRLDVNGRQFVVGNEGDALKPYVGFGAFWDGTKIRSDGAINYGMALQNERGTTNALTKLHVSVNGAGGGTKLMTVQGDGNVGIGTTAPSAPLHVHRLVAAGQTQPALTVNGNYGDSASAAAIDFTINGSASPSIRISNPVVSGVTTPAMAFSTANSGTLTEKMRITHDGNVGIGTTAPNLYAADSTKWTTATILGQATSGLGGGGILELASQLPDATNASSGVLQFVFKSNTTSGTNRIAAISSYTEGSTATARGGNLRFYTQSDGATGITERVRIDGNGNVGIGTTAPSSLLQVGTSAVRSASIGTNGVQTLRYDDNASNPSLIFQNFDMASTTGNGISQYFQFGTNTTQTPITAGGIFVTKENQWTTTASTQNSTMSFATTAAGVFGTKMTILSGGNVGIGSAAPGYKLDVNGSFNATSIYLNGTQLSTSGNTSSIPNGGGSVETITQSNTGAASANRSALTLRNNGTGGVNEFNLIGQNAAGATTSFISQSGSAFFQNSVMSPFYYGSSSSGADVTLDSTTHATKGNVLLAPSGGNVGVGTTSPTTRMTASVSSDGVNAIEASTSSGSGTLFLRPDGTNGNAIRYGGAGLLAGTLRFLSISDVERMRIDSNGRVGIGTTSPSNSLHVQGATAGGTTNNPLLARFYSSDAIAAGSGAGIALGGNYTGTTPTMFGYIGAVKENATDGDYAGKLIFGARANGGGTADMTRMTITSAGNVGIGTASPLTALHVMGIPLFDSAAGDGEFQIRSNRTVGAVSTHTWRILSGSGGGSPNHNFRIVDNTLSSERLTIDGVNGNVGIGTTAPATLLHLSSASPRLQLSDTDTGVTARIDADHSSGFLGFIADSSGAVSSEAIYFTTGATERVRIDAAGNVGIGTTAPSRLLEIEGSSTNTSVTAASTASISIFNSDTTVNNISEIAFRTADQTTAGVISSKILGIHTSHMAGSVSGDIAFVTRNAGTDSEKMRVLASGNVGIGSTAPTAKLDVVSGVSASRYVQLVENGTYGSSGTTSVFRGDNNNGAYPITLVNLETASGTANGVGVRSYMNYPSGPAVGVPSGEFYWGKEAVWTSTASTQDTSFILTTTTDGSNTEKLRINSSGNVGIGSASPAAKLDVAGTVKLGSTGTAFTAKGICTAASTAYTANTPVNFTCTGVPASTAVAVSCSPSAALAGYVTARATGTLNQIAITIGVSATHTMTCMWMVP